MSLKLISKVLNIDINEDSNDIYIDSNNDLQQNHSNNDSNNSSNTSFFSCESKEVVSSQVMAKDVKKEKVFECNIDKEVVFGSESDSMVGEMVWSESSEGSDHSNNVSLNESHFKNNSFNDRSISDEKKREELKKLLDKSKYFLQLMENNMFEEKQRLTQINDSNNDKIDSQLDNESQSNESHENKSVMKYSFIESKVKGKELRKSLSKSDTISPSIGLRRSQRKSVLQNYNFESNGSQTHRKRSSQRKRKSCDSFEDESSSSSNVSQYKSKSYQKCEPLSCDNSRDDFETERYFNGLQIDSRQPLLFSGGVMRDYQLEGLEWLRLLHNNDVNGILADEMGLGKTIQVIALIADLIENDKSGRCLGPYLVVAPLTTLHNWMNEFKRFAPLIPTFLFHGHKKERKHYYSKMTQSSNVYCSNGHKKCYPVVITSYEMVKFGITTFKKFNWDYVVVDEGHKIKNIETEISKIMRQIKSEYRLILTGTPLHNNLHELWSLLNYLSPQVFSDGRIFEEWLAMNSSNEQIIEQEKENQIVSAMHQILTPFVLRRTKQGLGLKLPLKKEVLIYAPSTLTQQKLYETAIELVRAGKSIESRFIESCDFSEGRKRRKGLKIIDYSTFDKDFDDWFEDDYHESGFYPSQRLMKLPEELVTNENSPQYYSFGRFTKNNIMMQMRKITNHPFLCQWPINPITTQVIVNNNLIRTSGKMRALDELLGELFVRKHRVLLFSQMTRMLDIFEDYCDLRQYKYLRLDGSTDLDIRRQNIETFNNNEDIFIFLVSTRAGGLGINLVGADTAIIYDSDWNPQMDLQAQDRCHRIGQSKPVIIYRLVTSNTIDEHMIKTAHRKRKLDKMIIQNGHYVSFSDQFIEDKFKRISLEELLTVLQSTDFKAIYNYSSDKLEADRLYSDEDLKKMLDRTQESVDSIIEIGAQNK